jgi:hypothetical protein
MVPFSTEFFRIAKRMMDRDPSSLNDKSLLDYHRKTHMLYAGSIKRKPINKEFINSIVTYHDKLAKELLKRNFKHNTPLKHI